MCMWTYHLCVIRICVKRWKFAHVIATEIILKRIVKILAVVKKKKIVYNYNSYNNIGDISFHKCFQKVQNVSFVISCLFVDT